MNPMSPSRQTRTTRPRSPSSFPAPRQQPATTPVSSNAALHEPEHIHTRDNPFHAAMVERRPLTSDVSSKLTMHLSLALEDSTLHYQAGDACGVLAQNDPALVDELLAHLPFSGIATVELAKLGQTTVREALLHHLQPTRLSRKIGAALRRARRQQDADRAAAARAGDPSRELHVRSRSDRSAH